MKLRLPMDLVKAVVRQDHFIRGYSRLAGGPVFFPAVATDFEQVHVVRPEFQFHNQRNRVEAEIGNFNTFKAIVVEQENRPLEMNGALLDSSSLRKGERRVCQINDQEAVILADV